jgi:hypothetical protein
MNSLPALAVGLPPFQTLAEKHLVYAYFAVWILQFGYGIYLAVQWRKTRP